MAELNGIAGLFADKLAANQGTFSRRKNFENPYKDLYLRPYTRVAKLVDAPS
jgi:hypothetical protein